MTRDEPPRADNSNPRSTSWLRGSLKALFVMIFAAAAFYAGWFIAARRTDKAVGDAWDAAHTARRDAARAKWELDFARALTRGVPPPPLPDSIVSDPNETNRVDFPPP
jgi:hypothetical protein